MSVSELRLWCLSCVEWRPQHQQGLNRQGRENQQEGECDQMGGARSVCTHLVGTQRAVRGLEPEVGLKP